MKYTYSILIDFTNATEVNIEQLKSDIDNSSITKTVIDTNQLGTDEINILFDDTLTTGEETELDTIVSTYEYIAPLITGIINSDSLDFTLGTGNQYINLLSFDMTGDNFISSSADIYVHASGATGAGMFVCTCASNSRATASFSGSLNLFDRTTGNSTSYSNVGANLTNVRMEVFNNNVGSPQKVLRIRSNIDITPSVYHAIVTLNYTSSCEVTELI